MHKIERVAPTKNRTNKQKQEKKNVSEMPPGIKVFNYYEVNYVSPSRKKKNVYVEVLMLNTSQYGSHTSLSHGNIF